MNGNVVNFPKREADTIIGECPICGGLALVGETDGLMFLVCDECGFIMGNKTNRKGVADVVIHQWNALRELNDGKQ